ncbi:MAG: 50S ribosomal protein L13 [bacterium]|nr:50S ribosomal protein L13 [bacterium]
MKTFIPKADNTERIWYIVNAEDKVLGRLASKVAAILRGKHKPIYAPHIDVGDYVIVINAAKVRLTGKKLEQKVYYHYSGYPGGLKETRLFDLMKKNPEEVIKRAVKGMLPKNKLGRKMLTKLKVYPDKEHHQEAQKPVPIPREMEI